MASAVVLGEGTMGAHRWWSSPGIASKYRCDRGVRTPVRQHFAACLATRCFDDSDWSRVFLARLHQDADWPRRIPPQTKMRE